MIMVMKIITSIIIIIKQNSSLGFSVLPRRCGDEKMHLLPAGKSTEIDFRALSKP